MRAAALASALAVLAGACGSAVEPGPEAGTRGDEPSEPAAAPAGLRVDPSGWRTDFSHHTVPLEEIWPGGPPRDGIPAIEEPRFAAVAGVEWLDPLESVIEVELGGEARAYPLQILVWHELVNDELAGVPVVVTFCPLCYTALVFDRRVGARVLDFGTTGNLRNADLVMYDRQTESWWQQFGGEAIVGELAGARLDQVPAAIVAWQDFRARHPDGLVLSRETGFDFPYGLNPYGGYDRVDRPPTRRVANEEDDRLLPKERVVLLERGGAAVAIPFAALERLGRIQLELGGERLEARWLGGVRTSLGWPAIHEAEVRGAADVRLLATGERVPFDTPFWFAVAAFRPDVRIVRG